MFDRAMGRMLRSQPPTPPKAAPKKSAWDNIGEDYLSHEAFEKRAARRKGQAQASRVQPAENTSRARAAALRRQPDDLDNMRARKDENKQY
jgi:hypothetical protein